MMDNPVTNPVLRALVGERNTTAPIWLMRQAGRYLPEYRAIREKADGFLNLCFNPKLAAEVTLQPIRRFGFDAAILFSGILVMPHALGQHVTFEQGEGPKLDALKEPSALKRLRGIDHEKLAPVYETIARVKQELPADVAFLGFCGAPWTVATYMIAGCGTVDGGGGSARSAGVGCYSDEGSDAKQQFPDRKIPPRQRASTSRERYRNRSTALEASSWD